MTSPSLLVARREVIQRVRRRSFLIFTALVAIVVIAGGVLAAVIGDDSTTSYDVGVVSAESSGDEFVSILTNIGTATGITIDTTVFDSSDAAAAALKDGDIDVLVDVGERTDT